MTNPTVILHVPHDSVVIPPEVRGQFLLDDAELQAELRRALSPAEREALLSALWGNLRYPGLGNLKYRWRLTALPSPKVRKSGCRLGPGLWWCATALDPLRRSRAGSNLPIGNWLLYAGRRHIQPINL